MERLHDNWRKGVFEARPTNHPTEQPATEHDVFSVLFDDRLRAVELANNVKPTLVLFIPNGEL